MTAPERAGGHVPAPPTECETCREEEALRICHDCDQRSLKRHHRQLAEKDARIRELEESRKQLAGAVERLLDCDLGRVDEKPWPPPNYDHIQEVEAALARSEGEGA